MGVQICAGVVCAIASLAYLTMSLGHGYISKCDGRSFYYARYVDWMLTTPLMLWDLCVLAKADSRTRLFIIYFLCYLDGGQVNICGFIRGVTDRRASTYRRAMNLTVISWIGYPVIWAVAEGSEVLNANGEAIAYTILDIISKSIFGYLLVFSEWGDFVPAFRSLGRGVALAAVGSSVL